MIENFGKILIFLGVLLFLLGIIFVLISKIPFLGKLPGDIYIKRKNFTFYFPIVSCLLLSFFISFIIYLISRFFK